MNEPKVLLLDEPLGALDLKLRKEMQLELKAMQRRLGITFVFVTHDQEEALTMSDRIALMQGGRIVQIGDPAALYNAPESLYAAEFIGETNLVPGVVRASSHGRMSVATLGHAITLPHAPLPPGTAVTLAIRPEAVMRATDAPDAARFEATLRDVVFIGTDLRLTYDIAGGGVLHVRVQNRADRPAPLPGERVSLAVCPADIRLFPN